MFPSFEIFGRTIGMYGVCAVAGMFAAAVSAYLLSKKKGVSIENIIMVILVIGAGLMIGGHLLYGITNIKVIAKLFTLIGKYELKTLAQVLVSCFGGSVFYGGFIGAWIALNIYVKKSHYPHRLMMKDLFAVSIPLFHAFGRIGCFLGGCCYGVECSWGFTVYDNTLIPSVNGVQRLPIALIEAGINILIYIALVYLYKKCILKNRLVYMYVLMYAPARFIIEFFRGDAIRGSFAGLTTSQWVSVLLLLFVGISLLTGRLRDNTECTE